MMIDLTTLTEFGREVRYTSPSGHTVQLGKLVGKTEEYALVAFHTKVAPKAPDKSMNGDPVPCDPLNLEFV